jgi:hypothetical protein
VSNVVKLRDGQGRPAGATAAVQNSLDRTGSPLVVDDNKVLAAALRRYLSREGLGLLRELDKALLLIESQLGDLQSGTDSCVFREAQQLINNQRCRNSEVAQKILTLARGTAQRAHTHRRTRRT